MVVDANNYTSQAIRESVDNYAQEVREKMLDKKAQYELSMKKLAIFSEQKRQAYSKYMSYKNNSLDLKDSSYLSAKNNYEVACSLFNDSEINSDILRDSLTSSIFYSGKINNIASLS